MPVMQWFSLLKVAVVHVVGGRRGFEKSWYSGHGRVNFFMSNVNSILLMYKSREPNMYFFQIHSEFNPPGEHAWVDLEELQVWW